MTTKIAAAQYEKEHVEQMAGRHNAVYNPLNKAVEELPVIYGFNNGGSDGLFQAVLIAEDGMELGAHLCSSEAYMPNDLGILEGTRPDRHKIFQAYYPEGYRMEFVRYEEVKSHKGLAAAFQIAYQAASKKEDD